MESLIAFFNKLSEDKIMTLLFTPIISVLLSMNSLLFGLLFLIFIDLLTGIRKTLYKNGIKFNILKSSFWSSIKSYLLRNTWRKSYEYALGIITVIVLESLIIGETHVEILSKTFTISELSVVVPACIEAYSIFENFKAVSGANIIDRLKEFIEYLQKHKKND